MLSNWIMCDDENIIIKNMSEHFSKTPRTEYRARVLFYVQRSAPIEPSIMNNEKGLLLKEKIQFFNQLTEKEIQNLHRELDLFNIDLSHYCYQYMELKENEKVLIFDTHVPFIFFTPKKIKYIINDTTSNQISKTALICIGVVSKVAINEIEIIIIKENNKI